MSITSQRNAKQGRFWMEDDVELIGKLFEDNIESVFGAPIDGPDNKNFVPPFWLFQALKQAVDSNADVSTAPLFKFDMPAVSIFHGVHMYIMYALFNPGYVVFQS